VEGSEYRETMSKPQRLIDRIYTLLLTEPDRAWSYEELARLLGSSREIVCARCLQLLEQRKITKIFVGSGKPRGRRALVSIRHEVQYPAWLTPQAAVNIKTVAVTRHILQDDDEDE
jgi:hypothetical protein